MQIIQLDDYGFCTDDIIPGVLVQGDIGQVYDSVAFARFIQDME